MTDADETNETQEHDDLLVSETDVHAEEREFALAFEDIPPSLMSYFEASKSRATVCEKLILQEVEDFTTSCEDLMNLPAELSKNTMELNEQDISETENDSCLETEAPDTVAASPRNEDETAADNNGEHLIFTSRILQISLTKEEIKEINEQQQTPRQKRHFEELKKEEQIRQRENDFQVELKKLMEAEKLRQMELQLMEKRAQEKLEQELLLQQELISNLQKQVKKERRMMTEELKRMKEEEDKKTIEEEKIKREKQQMEEEIYRKQKEEENKKMLEIRAEKERRVKEEHKKKEEEEERRKREEVKIKMEEEKSKREEEDGKKREEETIKSDMQRRKMAEEMKRKKEEELSTKEEEERKTKIEEEKNKEEAKCNKKTWLKREDKMNQMEREVKKKKTENTSDEKRQEEEGKTVVKVTGRNIEGTKKKHDDIRHMEAWREEEGRIEAEVTEELEARTQDEKKTEKERRDDKKMRDEQMGKREEENSNYRNMEEEIRPEEDDKAKIRKVEDGRTVMEGESREQEQKTLEKGDEGQMKEEVSENLKAEEQWPKSEEGNKVLRGQQEWMTGKNDLQERKAENNSMDSQTERERTGGTEPCPSSRLEDSTWSSSRTHTAQQQDPDTNQGQTCTDQRVEQQDAPASLLQSPREQKRLSWMKGCISWGKLSLQNRRKQKGSLRGRGLPRRTAEPSGPPPLCPDALLRSTGRRSVQEVTTVTLEDLPGCSVSTLVQCSQLQSLTLRRCGLKSLEGISHLSQLFYIDVTENDISFVDCENMTSLRVLRLGYNKLTSIHGLRGADNLDVLELSHNNITRIAGLESVRRLQRLSVDHNQLISTKGLRDVYTLLHLNCSHNHLASVEGLENSALLNTLDLRSNSLSEPPSLDNHVLLRELRLDDNSISSLQGLAACWLPLMQQLSVAQNRITRLPSMSDLVSLANLDLQFNCMSELHNVCESLEGCVLLRNVHLTGNPLQQESGWRSSLQKALPGLRAIDDQETDCFLSPPAVQQSSLASDSFLTFCQAQLQRINDLQQQHSRELSEAASSLDAVKSLCRHFTETLKLAEDQRFAHEYGDITASDGQTVLERTRESSEMVPAAAPSGNNSYWTFERSPTESWLRSLDTFTKVRETGPNAVSPNRTTSTHFKMAAQSHHQDLDLRSTAAIAIQQQWRKYRQKYGNISRRPLAGSQGDGANPEPGPFCSNHSVVDQHYAATVIQASWRGSSVRRRLASALAAVTFPSTREDDTFEEVDMDGFVFDEAELEKQWTLQLPEDSFSRHDPVSEPPPSPKFPGPLRQPCHYSHATHGVWRPKQAWVPEEEMGPAGRVSPESPHGKSPASSSVLSGISERSEKILEEWGFTDSHTALQMLKRAQNMKWKQQHKKKHRDPSVRLVLSTNCNYQLVPVEARNRAAPRSRNSKGAVCRTEMEAQQAQKTDPVKQESAQQRLHVQSDGSAHSDRFLPELSSDILRGGRVQLVADPVYSERHRASGLRANSSSSAQQHSSYPPRISLGHARTDVPSPNQVTAAPSVKERISFRDNPVQLSGGWGGGKKRNNVHK